MTLPPKRKYQAFAQSKIVVRRRTAVIAPPGSGKTRPIIDALVELGILPEPSGALDSRLLVICSGSAIATWRNQIPYWTENPDLKDDIYIVSGEGSVCREQWSQARNVPGIYITNSIRYQYDFNYVDLVNWDAVVVDEYHKFLRRRKNKTYPRFLKMSRTIPIVVLTTGSFMNKNPAATYTCFRIVEPNDRQFTSYWRFINKYCITQPGAFSAVEILGPKNIQEFKDITDRYLAYIPEDVVADSLPKGTRTTPDVEMTKQQAKVYNQIADEMIAMLEDSVVVASSHLSKMTLLRQILCCPRAVDASLDMGGGFEWIVDKLEDDPHCVIFVPFRPAVEEIHKELNARGFPTKRLYGGVDQDELDATREWFARTRGTIVCTITFGESFDLETCKTSYFLGYEHDVLQNKQAEGRTRRVISEHRFVTWNYLKYAGTVDEHILENLNRNEWNIQKVMGRPRTLIEALKGNVTN